MSKRTKEEPDQSEPHEAMADQKFQKVVQHFLKTPPKPHKPPELRSMKKGESNVRKRPPRNYKSKSHNTEG